MVSGVLVRLLLAFDGHVSAVDAIEYNEAPSLWQITHYLWPE